MLVFSSHHFAEKVEQLQVGERQKNNPLARLSNKKSSKLKNEVSIHPYVIVYLLEKLSHWELEKGFLSKEITLNSLAKSLGTNGTYLSRIVNTEKGMNFSNYVNNLRIEYILISLETKPIFTKYSVKALALEGGFKTSGCFSNTFRKKCGMYPSEYIKELNNSGMNLSQKSS